MHSAYYSGLYLAQPTTLIITNLSIVNSPLFEDTFPPKIPIGILVDGAGDRVVVDIHLGELRSVLRRINFHRLREHCA